MTGLEVAKQVVAEKQCYLFRARSGADAPGAAPEAPGPRRYDAKPYGAGSKRGWVALDLFSASAIVRVHDALTRPEIRAAFESLPVEKMARVALKLIK